MALREWFKMRVIRSNDIQPYYDHNRKGLRVWLIGILMEKEYILEFLREKIVDVSNIHWHRAKLVNIR